MTDKIAPYIAFAGSRRLAAGPLAEVARQAKELIDRDPLAAILIFDGHTSRPIDLDFRGTVDDVLRRLPSPTVDDDATAASENPSSTARGRPKLGVVAREVTLLPRHWAWLARQPGGASVTLRKLVEAARKSDEGKGRIREAQEAAYRFMSAVTGNEPGFEEAVRALFAGDRFSFDQLTAPWPADIRDHARALAAGAFPAPAA